MISKWTMILILTHKRRVEIWSYVQPDAFADIWADQNFTVQRPSIWSTWSHMGAFCTLLEGRRIMRQGWSATRLENPGTYTLLALHNPIKCSLPPSPPWGLPRDPTRVGVALAQFFLVSACATDPLHQPPTESDIAPSSRHLPWSDGLVAKKWGTLFHATCL